MVCYTGSLAMGQGVVQGTGTCSIESEANGGGGGGDQRSQAPSRQLSLAAAGSVCLSADERFPL